MATLQEEKRFGVFAFIKTLRITYEQLLKRRLKDFGNTNHLIAIRRTAVDFDDAPKSCRNRISLAIEKLKIMETLQHLSRKAMALQGDEDEESNIYQTLKMK